MRLPFLYDGKHAKKIHGIVFFSKQKIPVINIA